MHDPKHIQIADYDYPLPDERIAKYPKPVRDESKLLVYRHGDISETRFHEIPRYLSPDDLLVCNNTRVIQARLHFHKATGALIEVFCLEPHTPRDYQLNFASTGTVTWTCLVGNLKKWKEGTLSCQVPMDGRQLTLTAERTGVNGAGHTIVFTWDDDTVSFADILAAMGELPIPPYLNRATEESDLQTYQTVYSKVKGSVAAPTAGLHFTPRVLEALDRRGVEREEITLHVGAGTFKPVKSDEIGGHAMHSEWIAVTRHTVERLIAHGGRCVAVGTTSVRTLESLYYLGLLLQHRPDLHPDDLHVPQWMPYEGGDETPEPGAVEVLQGILRWMDSHGLPVLHATTQIIIAPGYHYHIIKAVITNFHQPKSTLLLLVSALIGEHWHEVYAYALARGFRFLSYGDSSLLIP